MFSILNLCDESAMQRLRKDGDGTFGCAGNINASHLSSTSKTNLTWQNTNVARLISSDTSLDSSYAWRIRTPGKRCTCLTEAQQGNRHYSSEKGSAASGLSF